MNKFLALAILFAAAGVANADNISKDKALEIAQQFMSNNGLSVSCAKGMSTVSSASVADSTEGHYIINNGNCFAVVASDDAASQQVLGYSTSSSFDPQNAPEGMKDFLKAYDQQMARAKQTGFRTAAKTAGRQEIMWATPEWDQSSPYNDQCPIDKSTGARSYTGCTSTAVAEIMYFHKCPADYDWGTFDFKYNESSSRESKAAVAKLMSDVGTALGTMYSSSVSLTDARNIPAILAEFGFSDDAVYLQRAYFDSDEWEQMVYDNLREYGPLEYNGTTVDGHSFVCDGYKDGYFHFNWGWGGACNDAYFTLSSLVPVDGSAGGGQAEDFSALQAAVFNIHPADDGKTYTVKAGYPESSSCFTKKFVPVEMQCEEEVNSFGAFDITVKVKNPYDERFSSDLLFFAYTEKGDKVGSSGRPVAVSAFADAAAGETVSAHFKFSASSMPAGTYFLVCEDFVGNPMFVKQVAVTDCELACEPELVSVDSSNSVVNIKLSNYDGAQIVGVKISGENGESLGMGLSEINGESVNVTVPLTKQPVAGETYQVSVGVVSKTSKLRLAYNGDIEFPVVLIPEADGINSAVSQAAQQTDASRKVMRNGKVYILKGGKTYTASGALAR